jgi:putative ABC transport system permease protein
MTAGVVALVVVACTLFLALISSLRRTLVSSGEPLNLVVMRKGSDNDGSSQITIEAYQAVKYLDGIARDATDQPLVSPELVVQPFFRTADGGRENVLVRGVEAMALAVHSEVRIAEGRMLAPSAGEAVVGKGVMGRYQGAQLGSELEFGRGRWKVVGVLESGGSSFESEVWVDARQLANDAKRPFPYSGIRLRAASPEAMRALEQRIDDDPRYAIEAQPESDYYAKQAESANALYVLVVGTLRALGFSRGAILWSFQVEAIALSCLGFLLGAVLALLLAQLIGWLLGGIAFGASTFTTNVITLRIAPGDLAAALLLAVVIGLAGGLGPAWRAARLRPIEALRKA